MDFNDFLEQRQVSWRQSQCMNQVHGFQNGRSYPWILPAANWEEGLWDGIRDTLPGYLAENDIQRHTGSNNLKSSWVLCANLYYPFGGSSSGFHLLTTFLCLIAPELAMIERVELEYAEDKGTGLHPSELLGERDGTRGSNQTSPDVAFIGRLSDGRPAIFLLENKLAEHSFYGCSARRPFGKDKQPLNPRPERCDEIQGSPDRFEHLCHQSERQRHYWKLLSEVMDREKLVELKRCPAATAGYQLFRQQALAEGFATSGKYGLVVSAVAYDSRNSTIQSALQGTGIAHLDSWGGLFNGRAIFRTFTHQSWVKWVEDHDSEGAWADWLMYVKERYLLTIPHKFHRPQSFGSLTAKAKYLLKNRKPRLKSEQRERAFFLMLGWG